VNAKRWWRKAEENIGEPDTSPSIPTPIVAVPSPSPTGRVNWTTVAAMMAASAAVATSITTATQDSRPPTDCGAAYASVDQRYDADATRTKSQFYPLNSPQQIDCDVNAYISKLPDKPAQTVPVETLNGLSERIAILEKKLAGLEPVKSPSPSP